MQILCLSLSSVNPKENTEALYWAIPYYSLHFTLKYYTLKEEIFPGINFHKN